MQCSLLRTVAQIISVGSIACIHGLVAAREFSPIDYGAIGDGVHDDTSAVRKAAEAAAVAAPQSVLKFPSGYTFLTSAFNISASDMTVEIERNATVLASSDESNWPRVPPLPWYGGPSDYQQSGAPMRQGFIYSDGVDNIVLTGEGTIDGNGSAWWSCWRGNKLAPPCLGVGRPHLILLSRGSNVTISKLRIQNSPCWTVHPSMIDGLHIYSVDIANPHDAPNTDGIDIDAVQNAVIENSSISVGDDALCVKSGIDWLGRTFGKAASNITFRNISVGTGHGISIGSETSAGVDGVVFRDIRMAGTQRGGRIKSQRGRGGVVQNILFERIIMEGVDTAFDFTLNYHPGIPPTNSTATPSLANVTASAVQATSAGAAWAIDGLPESFISGLHFENVSIQFQHKDGTCTYANAQCDGVLAGGMSQCPPCS